MFLALYRYAVSSVITKCCYILCGRNNVNEDFLHDIFQGFIDIESVFKNQSTNSNMFIYGILRRDENFLVKRLIINNVNVLRISKFSVKSFHFINQSNGLAENKGALEFLLFYSDGLHLVKRGNLRLGK